MRSTALSGVVTPSATSRAPGSCSRGLRSTPATCLYAGFIVLLAALIKIFSTPASLIPFQLALGVVSCAALYSLGNRLGGPTAGLVSALLYAANPDVQAWNLYYLTDSVYISLLIGCVWFACACIERFGPSGLSWVALVGLLPAVVRPDGWAVTPAALITLGATRVQSVRTKVGLSLGLAVVVAFVLMNSSVTRRVIDQFLRVDHFADGTVVFTSEPWRLSMPPDVLDHPAAIATLAAARVFAEVVHVRPHYSLRHNALIVLYLLPTYVFLAIGLVRTRHGTLRTLVVLLALGHLTMVAFTWADWDGRFLLHFLPTLFPFAAAGFSRVTVLD